MVSFLYGYVYWGNSSILRSCTQLKFSVIPKPYLSIHVHGRLYFVIASLIAQPMGLAMWTIWTARKKDNLSLH